MRFVEGVETRMIGRQAELETLKDAYYTVVEEGERQIVTVIGEAGVGKSRLLYEFENWVDLQPVDVRLYRGRAHLESRRLPYDLLRSLFAFRFNIQDDDLLEMVQEKWVSGYQEGFEQSDRIKLNAAQEKSADSEMRAHILGQLLGYDFADSPHVKPILGDPQQMRNRSLVYLEDYFMAVAQRMPIMVLLEDLHWADDSSLDTLSQLGLGLRETPILIVGAARPGLYERRPYWFEGREIHRRVNLKPLSRRANRLLVAEVLQKILEIPDTLNELIITNAEGNPFYVEELVKVLVEAEVIAKSVPHWQVDEQRLQQLDVPSTLTGVLQARLERLPKADRTLIQQASVVGRVFWDQAIWYLNHQGGGNLDQSGIEHGLVNLRGREMVYRRELSAFLDAKEYIFKHAVLREVTYESVLKKVRRAYHALAAEWLMEQRGDRSGEVVGLIADHLELAGEQKEALHHLRWAGEAAAEKYANDEAVDYYSRALALVPNEDLETRFELLLAREEILDLQAKREAERQDLESLESLAKEMDSAEKQMEVGERWSRFLWFVNDSQAAAAMAKQVVVQAEAAGNLYYTARGQLRWGRALTFQGQYEIARQHLDQALDGFQTIGDQRMAGYTLRSLGLIAGDLFDLDDWQDFSQQALSIARQTGNRTDEAEAINHLGSIFTKLGDYSTARRYLSQYLAITQEIGSRNQEIMALENLGEVSCTIKDYPSAQVYYEQSLAIVQATGNIGLEGNVLNGLGETLAGLERWNAAIQAFSQANKLHKEFGLENGIAFSRAGLARATLVQGDVVQSLSYVEKILDYMDGGEGFGQGKGFTYLYLGCAQVLGAAGDPRAREVLEIAYIQLQERADKIEDEALRHSFLENVPWNREIVRLWGEQQGK
jgi:predicted ATPase